MLACRYLGTTTNGHAMYKNRHLQVLLPSMYVSTVTPYDGTVHKYINPYDREHTQACDDCYGTLCTKCMHLPKQCLFHTPLSATHALLHCLPTPEQDRLDQWPGDSIR